MKDLTWVDGETNEIISRITLLTEYQKVFKSLTKTIKTWVYIHVGIILLNICSVFPINLFKNRFIRNLGIPKYKNSVKQDWLGTIFK